MIGDQQTFPTRRRYDTIEAHARLALIDRVELEDYTISVAAQELGIKLSTAKLIVARFRKTGTVFRRKREQASEGQRKRDGNLTSRTRASKQLFNSSGLEGQNEEISPACPGETAVGPVVAYPWVWICDWTQMPPLYSCLSLPQ